MNYDDLPLQVVKDLWLARFGTAVEFDRLTKLHAAELATGEKDAHSTPVNQMYKRLIAARTIEIVHINGVCWVQWEDTCSGPAASK